MKLITCNNIFILFFSILVQGILYCYYNHGFSKYTYQGDYYFETIGGHYTEILKFQGKYLRPETKNVVIVNIAGNPGIVQFYDVFLKKLHNLLDNEIDIYSIGQINHFEYLGKSQFDTFDVQQNIEHKQQFIKQLLEENPDRKFIFLGHSFGGYLNLFNMRVLNKDQILKTYMLYAPIFGMANTPSGEYNDFIRSEANRMIFGGIVEGIKHLIPHFIIRAVLTDYFQYEPDIIETVINQMSFSNSVNSMALANNELDVIDDIDEKLIGENLEKCHYYFGTKDGWVPLSNVEILKNKFPDMSYEIDQFGQEHAFVMGGSIKQAEIQIGQLQRDLPEYFQKQNQD